MTKMHKEYEVDEERLTDVAMRLIGERSPSGEERSVARLVAAEMEELGFEVETDELGNVIGTIEAGPGPGVIVDSHMDTVGVTDPEAWTYDPEGEMVDGRLYGRGAMDMKGLLAASVHGITALTDRLRRGKIVVSETVAGERVDPDYAVICEATSLKLARDFAGIAEQLMPMED